MHLVTGQSVPLPPAPNLAATYRAVHRHRLMLLTKLKGQLPTRGEFCRIKAVETAAPDLWITVAFLDGSTRGLRPDHIRLVTEDEERFAQSFSGPEMV